MLASTAVTRRVLLHAALLLFTFNAGALSDSPVCTLKSRLASATAVIGGSLTTVVSSGCLLLSSATDHVTLTSNTTISGGVDKIGVLDTQFAYNVVNASAPGLLLILDSLHLLNVNVELTPFLQLSAFSSVAQRLLHTVIETDCQTLYALASATLSGTNASVTTGAGYVYISSYYSSAVQAEDVNVTCQLPQFTQSGALEVAWVADSLQLLNAMVASQLAPAAGGPAGQPTIFFARNITLDTAVWRPARPLTIGRNITVSGQPDVLTVLDLQALVNMVYVKPGVGVTWNNLVVLNAGPLRGTAVDLATLPLFSLPVWFFLFTRDPKVPQVAFHNVTLVLTPSEFSYLTVWTLVLKGPLQHLSELAAPLAVTTQIIEVADSNASYTTYSQLRGTGLDMYNLTLSAVHPPVPHTEAVLDNLNLHFDLNIWPNMTHLPVYNLGDFMSVLQQLQDSQPDYRTALYILTNITIDPATWPAAGYRLTQPVVILGTANLGVMTWLDFRQVPLFVRAVGCVPEMYVYMQGMVLLNLPDASATQKAEAAADVAVAAGGSAGQASQQAAGGTSAPYVSLFFSNIAGETRGCLAPTLYLNQSTVVVSYAEHKLIRAMISRFVGSERGFGTVLGSNITFNRSTIVSNNISFLNIQGWGWSGYDASFTYEFPPGTPVLYNNVYDPPGASLELPPMLAPAPGGAKESSSSLQAWQVALIVVGAVALVALLLGAIAWRVVTRLRHQVEVVKSAASDKKSSSASADHEATSGGTRLGSSAGAIAGGGSQPGNGGPPVSAGAGNGGGKGSQGGGGGTSDDSTAPHFDRPPLEVLNSMMATLTQEMEDRHLTILEVIGQGGFGVVYKGMWKGLHVAVKTITFQDRVAGGEKAQHRAILEAAISSSLAHPNVVTTYSYDIKPLTVQVAANGDASSGCGQSGSGSAQTAAGGGFKIVDKRMVLDWKLYLIQEYCDGGSLRTAILKRKFFDAKKGEPRMEMILDTCLELTGGLMHLHERNIIHGDLNPNNVLLKRDSSKKYGAVCKIADFGLSIKMNADQSHISNMRRGTPFYTCPQILARGNMTKAADVYSMGVMMWEMYHCCMSYRSLPSGFQARESFPNFPRKAPAEFTFLVGSCLNNEPARRPTFAQLRSQFESQLVALKRGELRPLEDALGPDPAGDAAHLAACLD